MKCPTCRGAGKVRGSTRAQILDKDGKTIRTTTVTGTFECTTCKGSGKA
jgi:excinuclease UvrABC ATPase subunit